MIMVIGIVIFFFWDSMYIYVPDEETETRVNYVTRQFHRWIARLGGLGAAVVGTVNLLGHLL
jgi:hypothetical protein